MEILAEVKEVLSRMGLVDPLVELEVAPNGKVGGFVISRSFERVDPSDRQSMVWKEFEAHLSLEKQLQIISVITLTPDEAGLAA